MDVEKQIAYWRNGARESMDAARCLEDGEFWAQAIFWAHLAVEKALKAHVAKITKEVPPYIHILIRLAGTANIALSREQIALCDRLNDFQRLARYPDPDLDKPDAETSHALILRAKEFMEWLLQIL